MTNALNRGRPQISLDQKKSRSRAKRRRSLTVTNAGRRKRSLTFEPLELRRLLCHSYPPQAHDDAIELVEGATSDVLATGSHNLLDNDTDPDLPNDLLTLNTTPVVNVSHGTLTIHENGTFSYTHDGSENLSDQFVYEVVDSTGNRDTAQVTITVDPVNDAPTLTLPPAQDVDEDSPLAIAGVDVIDVDADQGAVRITMSVAHGQLTLDQTNGLTFEQGGGSNAAAMTFTGVITDVNAALATIHYLAAADYHGSDTLDIAVDDLANTGAGGAKSDSGSIAITVHAVNDAPELSLPGVQQATEDESLIITGIGITDADFSTGTVDVTLSVSQGLLTLAQTQGLSFTSGDGTGDASMAFSGALPDVNTAVAAIEYCAAADYAGYDWLSVYVDDRGNVGSGGAMTDSGTVTIAISGVNDAPQLAVPGDQQTGVNTLLEITGIDIADVDADTGSMELTLSAQRGRMTLATTSGLTFTSGDGTDDAAMTASGSLAALNAALATLSYDPTPGYEGYDTIDVAVSDLGSTGSGSALVDSDRILVQIGVVDDLIAWWTFNENHGSVAADTSPHGAVHDAPLQGNAQWTTFGLNGALQTDGSGDGTAIPNSNDFNLGTIGARTVSGWFYVTDKMIDSRAQVLFEEGGDARGLSIYVHDGRLYVGGWNRPSDESNWAGTFLSTDQIESGQWHHVALVLSGGSTVTNDALRGYLDGVEFAHGAGSQLWAHSSPSAVGQAADGVRFHSGFFSGGNGFAGMLDDMRVYNRALKDSEVSALSAETPAAPQRLTVSVVDDAIAENGSAVSGTVSRVGDLTTALVVNLTSSDPGRLTVPATITLGAGESSGTFQLTPQDNGVADGPATIVISATAEGTESGEDSLVVVDDEMNDAGLVAYWAMDEGSGSTAADTSPYGHDHTGTLVDDTSWSPMGLNHSLRFDGSGDRLAVPSTSSINIAWATQRTVSLWFAVDDVSVNSRKQVLYEEGGSTRGINVYLYDGRLYVGGWNAPHESNWTGTFLSTDQIQSGQWHHVALVLNGGRTIQTDVLKAYLDGSEFGSGLGSQIWTHSDLIGIGQAVQTTKFHDGDSGGGHGYAGLMDEVRVYSRALAAPEIEQLANQDLSTTDNLAIQLDAETVWESGDPVQGTITRDGDLSNSLVVTLTADSDEATVPGTVTILAGRSEASFEVTPFDDVLSDGDQHVIITASASGYRDGSADLDVLDDELNLDGLVAHWQFDEAGGATVIDTSPYGQNNSGTLGGNAVRVDEGLVRAVKLDGDGDRVFVADSGDINTRVVSQRTVALWFSVDDPSISTRKQVLFEEGGATRGLNIYVFDGALFVGGWNSVSTESGWNGTFLATSEIQAGQWHHVALVLDGGSTVQPNAIRGYLDGVQFGSGAGSQVWTHNDDTGLGGAAEWSTYHTGESTEASNSYAGLFDDVRIYNRALNAAEITLLADQTLATTERLTVSAGASSIAEQGGSATFTVERSGDTSSAVVVTLDSSDVSEAIAPATVTIQAGQSSAAFNVTAVDDTVRDGDQSVVITASAVDMASGSHSLLVQDDEEVLVYGVVQNVTDTWTTVMLPQDYASMVVVATPNYDAAHVPVVTRVRNASADSFELRVERTDGSLAPVTSVAVHYVVAEEGVYTAAQDGVQMEVARFDSTVTDGHGNWVGQQRSYAQAYQNPVVLGQVLTANDSDFSVFWSSGAATTDPASSAVLRVGKHVGEDPDTSRAMETIGYMVIESGTATAGTASLTAGVGAATIQGMDDTPPFEYSLSGLSAASVAVAGFAGMYGDQGGWAVLYGDDPVNASRVRLAADEDQAADAERNHVGENVGYLVFEDSALRLHQSSTGNPSTLREITREDVESLLWHASALWGTEEARNVADRLTIEVADLPGSDLARVSQRQDQLLVDLNAAGQGWFVDGTATGHEEFASADVDNLWRALEDGPAADRVDLLSVLAHEIGHLLGYGHQHDQTHDVMFDTLRAGVRRLPYPSSDAVAYCTAVDQVLAER